jgi:ribulose-5-phosphate 4-epimerase/fuculose-1-phosphate aldolase
MPRMSAEPSSLDATRETIAVACRILARHGLVEGILGHVSARVDGQSMLIRCRGPEDRGVLFTQPSDVRLVDLDGMHLEESDGYDPPNELPIHGELYKARPETAAVVHAHPPASVLCGIAGLPLRPVFGAFNIPAMRLALDGVPVFPRACLITRADLAGEMIAAMDGRDVCLLRGHGITSAGRSVQAATVQALDLDALARVTVELAQVGTRDAPAISDEDVAELPDLGPAFNEERVWRHLVALEASRR